MIVTFANGKGGTGKTTLCVCVAMGLARAGKRVAVSDRDPQGTAAEWVTHIATDQGPFLFDVAAGHKPADFDVLLIDTPPNLAAPETRAAITEADKVIIVSSPSPADIATTQRTAAVVAEIRGAPAKTALCFNKVQPRTLLGRELEAAAKRVSLPALFFSLRHRQCYQHAVYLGWRAFDTRAQEEILFVTREILSL
jgi:chromosome partitioning protein